jgi:hypothetical protein
LPVSAKRIASVLSRQLDDLEPTGMLRYYFYSLSGALKNVFDKLFNVVSTSVRGVVIESIKVSCLKPNEQSLDKVS